MAFVTSGRALTATPELVSILSWAVNDHAVASLGALGGCGISTDAALTLQAPRSRRGTDVEQAGPHGVRKESEQAAGCFEHATLRAQVVWPALSITGPTLVQVPERNLMTFVARWTQCRIVAAAAGLTSCYVIIASVATRWLERALAIQFGSLAQISVKIQQCGCFATLSLYALADVRDTRYVVCGHGVGGAVRVL